jgi:hypothetical protein
VLLPQLSEGRAKRCELLIALVQLPRAIVELLRALRQLLPGLPQRLLCLLDLQSGLC